MDVHNLWTFMSRFKSELILEKVSLKAACIHDTIFGNYTIISCSNSLWTQSTFLITISVSLVSASSCIVSAKQCDHSLTRHTQVVPQWLTIDVKHHLPHGRTHRLVETKPDFPPPTQRVVVSFRWGEKRTAHWGVPNRKREWGGENDSAEAKSMTSAWLHVL